MQEQVRDGHARSDGIAPPAPRSGAAKARVVLLQTQAEAAGAQEISRILGAGLTAQGYDVHHGFFFRRTAVFDAQPNTFFCARERPTSPLQVARMFMALVRHLKELQPDAVVCFQHYGNVVGTLAARLAGARRVITNRNSPKSHIPRWLHALDLTLGVAGWFQAVVVNSSSVEKEYADYPRRYRRRVVRIDHGFESKATSLGRDEARKAFGLPADVVLLGSAARFHPDKNLEAAIRLLADRNWHLALAGQGAAREQLIDAAGSLGVLDRLHLVGELPANRIGDFLGALDVFVFPSLAETFGLAVVEAAQAGIPVVANDLEVLREVLSVEGEPCALFVDVDDTQAFAEAVRRILGDRNLRTQLRLRAAKLSSRYSLDAMVRRYAALIEAAPPQSASLAQPALARPHVN
jgi:glycosyltransferase involved in cell wall biosynthesis